MDESVSEVYILDDDVSVREAVGSLIRSVGLKVRTFASAQEFLTSLRKERRAGWCWMSSFRTSMALNCSRSWRQKTFRYRLFSSPVMATFRCRCERSKLGRWSF